MPDVGAAFASAPPAPGEAAAYGQLEAEIDEQVERAATSAFSWPFLATALMAALALIPTLRLGTTTADARWTIAPEPR